MKKFHSLRVLQGHSMSPKIILGLLLPLFFFSCSSPDSAEFCYQEKTKRIFHRALSCQDNCARLPMSPYGYSFVTVESYIDSIAVSLKVGTAEPVKVPKAVKTATKCRTGTECVGIGGLCHTDGYCYGDGWIVRPSSPFDNSGLLVLNMSGKYSKLERDERFDRQINIVYPAKCN